MNIWVFAGISVLFSLLNGYLAKRRGYYFWRAFFFGLILCIAIAAIFMKALF